MKNFLILILWCFGIALFAQGNQDLTLSDAIQKAIKNSPEIAKLKYNDAKNAAELASFNTIGRPQVNGELSLGFNPVLPTQQIPDFITPDFDKTIPVQFGTFQNHQATVSANQVLYSAAVKTGREVLKKSFEFNEINSLQAKENLAYEVAKLYFQIQSVQLQTTTIDANIKQLNALLNLATGRQNAGLGLGIDVDRIKVNINNLNAQKDIINGNAVALIDVLNIIIGNEIGTPIALVTKDIDVATVDNKLNLSAVNSSTLTILSKQKELTKLQIEAALAENKPTIAAFAQIGGQMQGTGPGDLFKLDRYSYFGGFGLNLKMPIYNGKKNQYKAQSIEYGLLQIDQDKRAVEMGLKQQYSNAYQGYATAQRNLRSQEENIALAKKVYAFAQDRYNQGVAPLTEVIDAQKSVTEAENMIAITDIQAKLSLVEISKIVGNILNIK